MRLYERIKSRREELGLSQEELAHRVGYKDRSSIAKIESGVNDITQSKIAIFAKALETTTLWLMGDTEAPPAHKLPSNCLPLPRTVKKPRLGAIACGKPILAVENISEYDDVPITIHCDFTLLCKGDSMIDARIWDGDVVYIRQQPEVENGEIAAVRIGEEATLKRVYYQNGTLTLMPANAAYAPMVYTGPELNDVQIEGKAVGWTHWVG